ncbi:MAG: hypothetical protein AAF074_07455 [Pseudomonadota bacterium]
METHLYTIHSRAGREHLRAVGDGTHPLSVLPPLWAIWRGLWIVFVLEIAVMALTAWYLPLAGGTVWLALIALTYLEGGSIERAELRLRGWRPVALAEARSEEGAEEAYLTGRAVAL